MGDTSTMGGLCSAEPKKDQINFKSHGIEDVAVADKNDAAPGLREEAIEIFNACDCAGGKSDGKLTKNELKKYCQANENARKLLLGDGGWARLWEAIDTDGDGEFSQEEFVGFYLKQAAKIGNKKPPSMQFVTIEVSSLEGEFD